MIRGCLLWIYGSSHGNNVSLVRTEGSARSRTGKTVDSCDSRNRIGAGQSAR
jgi:hypothetical protein